MKNPLQKKDNYEVKLPALKSRINSHANEEQPQKE